MRKGKVEKTFTGTVQAQAADAQRVEVAFNWDNPRLWDLDQPNLYTLRLGVKGQGLQDSTGSRLASASSGSKGRKFMLNGSEFRLRTYLINGGDGVGIPEVIDSRLEGMRRSASTSSKCGRLMTSSARARSTRRGEPISRAFHLRHGAAHHRRQQAMA
jgi:hypothetical protein